VSKTAPIPDDVHALIIDKQTELKRKHKITVKISDLIAMYVRHGIKKTEKLLGLKTDEESEVVRDEKSEVVSDEKQEIDSSGKSKVSIREEGGKS
jgi:hypothetical protein